MKVYISKRFANPVSISVRSFTVAISGRWLEMVFSSVSDRDLARDCMLGYGLDVFDSSVFNPGLKVELREGFEFRVLNVGR